MPLKVFAAILKGKSNATKSDFYGSGYWKKLMKTIYGKLLVL